MQSFDEWKFLAGLGTFLFSIFMMEESIHLLSGRSFKTLVRRFTGTRIRGLITGFTGTAVLQSSSAVCLMVLAFVGAGLMTLVNGVATIMGAKIGTTITAWIVAVFGFSFKIETFSLPMIGIGGLGLIVLSSSPRYVNISKLLASLGFLFLGLDFMKVSVEGLAASVDTQAMKDLGLWVYVLAGVLLTAVIMSSSVTIALVLTSLFSGIIDFQQGAAMVIGANIGATAPILLGAIGGIPVKKQAAASSLVFTLGTSAVALPALPVMLWLVADVFGLENNPVLGIACFHTLFNVMGAILFFPFIADLARFLQRLFVEKRTVAARFIVNTSPLVPEAAMEALRREILHQLHLSMSFIAVRYGLLPSDIEEPSSPMENDLPAHALIYQDLEQLHAEIFSFYAQVQSGQTTQAETARMEAVIRASRSIMNATQNLNELQGEIEEIGDDDDSFMMELHHEFISRLEALRYIVQKVTRQFRDSALTKVLDRFFTKVEESDKKYIHACSAAVAQGDIQVHEVTRILMVNRLFTQASRMLVLSMRLLVGESETSGDSVGKKASSS